MASPAPFAIAPLRGRFDRRDGTRVALPTEIYRLRIATLVEPLYEAVSEAILVHGLYEWPVQLGDGEWRIGHIGVNSRQDRDARLTSYASLWRRASAYPTLTLRWLSPAVFDQATWYTRPSLAWHVFAGLAEKWRAFAPMPLPDNVLAFVETRVNISSFHLDVRPIAEADPARRGFIGHCRFRAAGGELEDQRAWQALAAFAHFAGTGNQTTLGMGDTRLIPEVHFHG